MKQQVDITLKLSLWLDAELEVDDITTFIRASLPEAFGEALTDMENPVDILDIREEAAIYSPSDTSGPTRAPWAVYRLAEDADTYGPNAGRLIVTTADAEVEITGPIENEDDAHILAAAPELLAALHKGVNLTLDEETDEAHASFIKDALAAIAKATRRAA